MDEEKCTPVNVVNAYLGDDTSPPTVVVTLRTERFEWEKFRLSISDAVQLADQLYLLTDAR